MGIDPATELLGGGLVSAIAGGMQKSNAVPSTNGFDAYPQQVKDYMVNTLLPQIQKAGAAPYQAPPMVRATNNPNPNFANPQMQQLQNYSDAVGGLFQPQGRNQGGMPAVRTNGGFAPAQGQMPGQGQQQPGQGAGQMTPQSAAQQFLQQTQGPGGRPSQVGNYVSTGATSLGDLGSALLGQGYTGGKVTPGQGAGNIDYAALYKALGI